MLLNKKGAILSFLCLVMLFFIFSGSIYAKYPEKSLKCIVPWSAGGGTDLTCRAIQKVIPKYLGEEIVVENKTGAAATIANNWFIKQPADGYTFIVNTSGIFNTQPFLKDVDYQVSDYKGVINLTWFPMTIAVSIDAPFDDIQGFLEYYKKRGKPVSYAHTGAGTIPHLTGVAFCKLLEIEGIPIACEGSNPALLQLMGGHVDFASVHPRGVLAHGDKLKMITIAGDERDQRCPTIKTFKEQGYDLNTGVWMAVYVPSGTPQERVDILHDAFKQTLEDEEFLEIAKNMDLNLMYMSGDEIDQRLKDEGFFYENLFKEIGVIE